MFGKNDIVVFPTTITVYVCPTTQIKLVYPLKSEKHPIVLSSNIVEALDVKSRFWMLLTSRKDVKS